MQTMSKAALLERNKTGKVMFLEIQLLKTRVERDLKVQELAYLVYLESTSLTMVKVVKMRQSNTVRSRINIHLLKERSLLKIESTKKSTVDQLMLMELTPSKTAL
jgi:hypothetical protein